MEATLLSQGIQLMAFGMGVVFTFLTLLVFGTGIMSKVINTWFPEPEPVSAAKAPASTIAKPQQDEQLVAVISAAIHKHRSRDK